jgi:uncharacterized membrane protein YjjP (DUF1212 family)
MRYRKWIPAIGSGMVALVLSVAAGLGDWSAIAVYGCLFVSVATWVVLFGITDDGQGSSQR